MLRGVALLIIFAPVVVAEDPNNESGWHFRWDDYPEFRYADSFQLDLRFRIQGNIRRIDIADEPSRDRAEVRRSRAGIEGQFLEKFEYAVEFELDDSNTRWRDAWLTWSPFRSLEVQAGRFKIPFGRDQLTGMTNLDFAFRSRLGADLAPARDIGIMAHGRALDDIVCYQAGIFRTDGDNSRNDQWEPTAGRTLAGRFLVRPFRAVGLPTDWKGKMEIGIAWMRSLRYAQSGNSIRSRTINDQTHFRAIPVSGNRIRSGAEWAWFPGPISLQAEAMRLHEDRRSISVNNTVVPNLQGRAWYGQATWLLTGEAKTVSRMEPRHPLFAGGYGAFEVAAREEAMIFRASAPDGSDYRATTVGLNWYPDRYFKIQVNWMRERVNWTPHRTWMISMQTLF